MPTVAAQVFDVAVVLAAGLLGGALARRAGAPAVLGELAAGFLLAPGLLGGGLGLGSVDGLLLRSLATLGAIVLLLEAGLETPVSALRGVGGSALRVAALGVVASWAAGALASMLLVPLVVGWVPAHGEAWVLHVFVGAALTATSIGVTAGVLRELRRIRSPASRIILAAAVADDVLGLLALAVVLPLASGQTTLQPGALAWALAPPVLFVLAFPLLAGPPAARLLDAVGKRGPLRPVIAAPVTTLWGTCAAYLATWSGLAGIVGAFLGGLVLAPSRAAPALRAAVAPWAKRLAPFFFVTLGMRADLVGLQGRIGPIAVVVAVLLLAAVLGKLASGLGVAHRVADRLAVGVGMVPRGEVGFVFAALGLSAGLLAPWQYTAILLVAAGTTFITPLWLRRLRFRLGPEDAP